MSIRKLPGGRYEWRHRVDGRHLKRTFARRADAAAWDARVRADVARGTHVDLSSQVTVAEYARAWSAARVLRPGTRRIHDVFLRHHVEGTPLGGRPIVRVRPSEIQAWVAGRSAILAPGTLRNYLGMLRSVFAAAALDGVIARNPVLPAGRLSLPRRERPKIVPLTVAQVQAWAGAAPPRIRATIIAQAALGLRISELRALRLADVDFLRREVRVEAQLDPAGRHRVPLNSANAARTVPLPTVASEALAGHIAQFPPAPDGTIFTTATGRPWSAGGMLRPAYSAAAAAAGLPEGTSSHDLRHHYASVLLAAGESVHAVAERIGDTPAMVLAVYGHVMPTRRTRPGGPSTRPGRMCPVCTRLRRPSRLGAVKRMLRQYVLAGAAAASAARGGRSGHHHRPGEVTGPAGAGTRCASPGGWPAPRTLTSTISA